MKKLTDSDQPPIIQAIGFVGVGKKGSKSLPTALIQCLCEDILNQKVDKVLWAAFLPALLMKGVNTSEEKIFTTLGFSHSDHQAQIRYLTSEIKPEIEKLVLKLLDQQTLSESEAYELGVYLFSQNSSNELRAICASILRVRYETMEEYKGLFDASSRQVSTKMESESLSKLGIQITEPFDGVERSYLVTPAIGSILMREFGVQVIFSMGSSSGPKLGCNLKDVCSNLQLKMSQEDFGSRYGQILDQDDFSSVFLEWQQLRRRIKKRPFMATLERFYNPYNSEVLIVSAFHSAYKEKMARIAGLAGFKACIVVSKGSEGTVGLNISRSSEVTAHIYDKSQGIEKTREWFVSPKDLDLLFKSDPIISKPCPIENAELISQFIAVGKSNNLQFNAKVDLTIFSVKKALKWVLNQLK